MASTFESLRYLTTSVWLRSVDKEEDLFTCWSNQVVSSISVCWFSLSPED